ncbi:hypothetical protein [Dongia sp.]|uniref:hypothetical protein n=1 Tax=Dongia sp. TaxID=1977262 RepID=UPI0035B0F3B6
MAAHVGYSDQAELQATAADLQRAMLDTSLQPDDIAYLTNYDLQSRQDVLNFLQTLAELLAAAQKA